MLVNSALELGPHDADFRRVVADELTHIEAFFRRCVQAAQQARAVTTTQSAEDLARLLLSVLLGIRVLARTRPQRALLEGVVRPVLSMLEPPISIRRSGNPPIKPSTRP